MSSGTKKSKAFVGIELGGASCKVCFFLVKDYESILSGKVSLFSKLDSVEMKFFLDGEKKDEEIFQLIQKSETLLVLKFSSTDARTSSEVVEKLVACVKKFVQPLTIGIACFGPLDLDVSHEKTYGSVTENTPKQMWRGEVAKDENGKEYHVGTPVFAPFVKAFGNIVKIDTDVNAPAVSEAEFSGCSDLAYVTLGTGLGVGSVVNGKAVHGFQHPEGGHFCPPLHWDDLEKIRKGEFKIDDVERKNICMDHRGGLFNDSEGKTKGFKGNYCIEALVATPALSARTGKDIDKLHEVSDKDKVWEIVAFYLSHLCSVLIFFGSKKRIVLGGGVVEKRGNVLMEKIHNNLLQWIGGYLKLPLPVEEIVVTSKFKHPAGIVGSLFLGLQDYNEKKMK